MELDRFLNCWQAVSPVIGVVIMVVLTILLASTLFFGVSGYSEDLSADGFNDAVTTQKSTHAEEGYSYGDNITAVDQAAGASTRHVVTLNVTGDAVGNSLNQITVDYAAGDTDVSTTAAGDGLENLSVIALDKDSDGEWDTDVKGDVESADFRAENSGSKLVIELSGNYNLEEGDKVVIVYDEAVNPGSSGAYDVNINLNGDLVFAGELNIG